MGYTRLQGTRVQFVSTVQPVYFKNSRSVRLLKTILVVSQSSMPGRSQ